MTICIVCKEKIRFFQRKIELKGKKVIHLKCFPDFLKSKEGKKLLKEAVKKTQIQQVKEALKIGAPSAYTPKELRALGFSEKDIKQLAKNKKDFIKENKERRKKEEKHIEELMKPVKIHIVKEALKTRVTIPYTPKEVRALGFSEKDIKKLIKNKQIS